MSQDKKSSPRPQRLIRLWLRVNEGFASEEELAELSHWLEHDQAARRHVACLAHQQGWLTWNGLGPVDSALSATNRSGADISAVDTRDDRPQVCNWPPVVDSRSPRAAPSSRNVRWVLPLGYWIEQLWTTRLFSPRGAGLVLLVVGLLLWQATGNRLPTVSLEDSHNFASRRFTAHLVDTTHCVWGLTGSSAQPFRANLTAGDALELREGIASLTVASSGGAAEITLEGPAALHLGRERTVALRYGRIVVRLDGTASTPFAVDTPFGRAWLEPGSETGILCFGSAAELHAFVGDAVVESPWFASDGASSSLNRRRVPTGRAMIVHGTGGKLQQSSSDEARRSLFTPQIPLAADWLPPGDDYARSVRAARPMAYWRFEQRDGNEFLNEMGGRWPLRIEGEVRTAGAAHNLACSLGEGAAPGALVVDEPWIDVLRDAFALELWIKPSHRHLGALASFHGQFAPIDDRQTNRHGILLEACSNYWFSDLHPPEKIRLLHRSAAATLADFGVNCYSNEPYALRRWQHVVAQRREGRLEVYLDGKLVGSSEDATVTPRKLQLALGRMTPDSSERGFVGHVDEVAIYDRALTPEEITSHHRALRPHGAPAEMAPPAESGLRFLPAAEIFSANM